MRVTRFKNFADAFQIPESTANQYYFDPKIVTIGQPKFNTTATHQRISNEEFTELRAKVVEKIKKGLGFVKFLYYFRFIVAALSLLLAGLRMSLRLAGGFHVSRQEYYIMFAIIVIPNLLANYLWRKVSRKFSGQVQAVLDEENREKYTRRGITWKISPNLHYMQISFRNDAQYQPPHQQGNSIQNYPVNYRDSGASERAARVNQQDQGFAVYRGLPALINNEDQESQNQRQLPRNNEIVRDSGQQERNGNSGAAGPQVTYDYRNINQGNPQVHFHQ